MKDCPDCRSSVPDDARVCASCGYRWLRWYDPKAPVGFFTRLIVAVVCLSIIWWGYVEYLT